LGIEGKKVASQQSAPLNLMISFESLILGVNATIAKPTSIYTFCDMERFIIASGKTTHG
jgi:hypothetical protein